MLKGFIPNYDKGSYLVYRQLYGLARPLVNNKANKCSLLDYLNYLDNEKNYRTPNSIGFYLAVFFRKKRQKCVEEREKYE
jgi:hypothetical protein